MDDEVTKCIVRIWDDKGGIAGAGFLVPERLILTCAHVVERALSGTTPKLQDRVKLDFPWSKGERNSDRTARLIHYVPYDRKDGTGDIAGLELVGGTPTDITGVRLQASEKLEDHEVIATGFPTGQLSGVSASYLVVARTAAGLMQIDKSPRSAYIIEPGFSGTPVWDKVVRGVIGMVHAKEINPNKPAAFFIPSDMLTEAWSRLRRAYSPQDTAASCHSKERYLGTLYVGWREFMKAAIAVRMSDPNSKDAISSLTRAFRKAYDLDRRGSHPVDWNSVVVAISDFHKYASSTQISEALMKDLTKLVVRFVEVLIERLRGKDHMAPIQQELEGLVAQLQRL